MCLVPNISRHQKSQFNTDSVTPATMLLKTLDLGLYHTIIISVSLAVMSTLSNQLLGALLLAEVGDFRCCRRCASAAFGLYKMRRIQSKLWPIQT